MRAGWETAASCDLSDENPMDKQIELLKTVGGWGYFFGFFCVIFRAVYLLS